MTTRYETKFTLNDAVNDFNAAASYLTGYALANELEKSFVQKVENIDLVLEDDMTVIAIVYTYDDLSESDLSRLSDWLYLQVYSSVAQRFERQPFAETRYDEPVRFVFGNGGNVLELAT